MKTYGYLLLATITILAYTPVYADSSGKSPSELLQEYERQFPDMDFKKFCIPGSKENSLLRELGGQYESSTDPEKRLSIKKKLAVDILKSGNHPGALHIAKSAFCEDWEVGADPSPEWIRFDITHSSDVGTGSKFIIPR